ncbi:hypothetical protein CA267_000270 [Alteromonas pelagimontana]|uniref:Polyhydroxybutyrate depolymerase n=1 Tax=Alteromonas pelagimontana TaxID=1858656 RepID=A0A6M4M9J0_9ALTE|nr:PHB depolymerase family esterase [Alteromonas pelagimontana]QJR79340.1 hypothetical protein CA267_000270 [Alteromonas pelagimontana]
MIPIKLLSKSVSKFGAVILTSIAASSAFNYAYSQETLESEVINVEGKKRHYRLFVPSAAEEGLELPLVLNFHGTSSTPQQQAKFSDMEDLAEKEGFFVVSPAAIYKRKSDGPNTWNVDKDPKGVSDVSFVKAILEKLKADYPVDESRIYATGFSGGARMSSRLACDMANDIAAIGPVAGVRYPEDCEPARPVPVVTFHGTKDTVNHYEVQEDSPSYWRMGVEKAVDGWIKHNGCNPEPEVDKIDSSVTRFTYTECKDNADILFYRSETAGHTWPGSASGEDFAKYGLGKTDEELPATKFIWAFFSTHPLPGNEAN